MVAAAAAETTTPKERLRGTTHAITQMIRHSFL